MEGYSMCGPYHSCSPHGTLGEAAALLEEGHTVVRLVREPTSQPWGGIAFYAIGIGTERDQNMSTVGLCLCLLL